MDLTFLKLQRNTALPQQAINTVFLTEDNWDDFGFKTIFFVTVL